jgi:penicillin-binding protein 2
MLRSLDALRDTRRVWAINRSRLIAALIGISTLLAVLVYRYYSLQITQHDDFLTQSDRNRIRVEVIPPPRGQIVDRKGRVLAANKPTFVVGVILERSEDSEALIDTLAQRLSLTESELEAFRERSSRRRPFEAVPLKLGLDDEALASVAVDLHQLPGVVVDAQLTRYYPFGHELGHVLGYVLIINLGDALLQTLHPPTLQLGRSTLSVGLPGFSTHRFYLISLQLNCTCFLLH